VLAYAEIPALGRLRQENLEFRANLHSEFSGDLKLHSKNMCQKEKNTKQNNPKQPYKNRRQT
jgi:hypothetical protein